MTTPVEVACNALRSDAAKWTTAGDAVEAAALAADGLALGEDQLGAIAATHGVVAAYGAMQQKFAGLLRGGATEFDALSTTLVSVADTYQREDAENARLLAGSGG